MGLPKQVLVRRINNELGQCSEYLEADLPAIPEDARFPLEIPIDLVNHPAYVSEDRMSRKHACRLIISEEYPFRKPEARWITPIFHPNIMMPEDGGYVCLRTLDDWSFGSSMLAFVKSLEHLIGDPRPKNPFGTESCLAASRFFSDNPLGMEMSVSYGGR
jgi:ubiquitin-protein ligase